MTVRQSVAVAATTHSGQPRLAYLNRPGGRWTMVTVDPVSLSVGGNDLMQVDYPDGADAMRALLFPTTYFEPADPLDVEEADQLMRSSTVDLFYFPVEIADDGSIIDVRNLLDYVTVEPGQPMRPERAVRELTDPTPPGGGAAVGGEDEDDDAGAQYEPVDLGGGRTYQPRHLFGDSDVQFLRRLRAMGGHIRLSGPPGAGKTTVGLAAFGDDVIPVQGHPDLTVAALCGQYLPSDTDHGRWVWSDGPLTRAMREGKVLLVDEVNRAPKDIDDVLLPAVDDRRQLVLSDRPDLPPIQAADGFMVVATYNDTDSGIRPLSAALRRRLNMHVHVDTDYQIARRRGIDDDLVRVAENLRTSGIDFGRRHDSEPSWYPQMADLEGAQKMLAFGAQAAFTAMTASVDDRGRLRDAADAFSAVFGELVRPVAELGQRC